MGRKAKITSADKIKREQRTAAIIQMRLAGFTLREIGAAQHPPVSNVAIYKTIRKALDRMGEAAEEIRRLEALRLDELTTAVYETALGGDLPAIDRTLQIMARRSRLLGLDQPVRSGSGANEFDQPTLRVEVVGGEEMAHAEQAARSRLGLGPHLG